MFRPSLEGFDLVQRVDVEVPGFGFYHVVAGMLGICRWTESLWENRECLVSLDSIETTGNQTWQRTII